MQQNIQMKALFLFRSVGFSLRPECSEKLTGNDTNTPNLEQSNFSSVFKWEFMCYVTVNTNTFVSYSGFKGIET